MTSNTTFTIQSRVEKETSHFNVTTGTIDVASLPAFLVNIGNFKTALAAIIVGTLRHEAVKIYDTLLDATIPGDLARRELKLLCSYTGDVTGDRFTIEVACPDLAALTMESGDANYVNLADAGVAAQFVTDWASFVTSPNDNTEATTLNKMKVVGRNI